MTCFLHSTLFLTAVTACVQVAKPILCLSPSTVLLHVSLGRPLLLFPSDAQVKAMLGFWSWWSMHSTCLIQCHLCLLICSLMVQVLACLLTSSFYTLIGHYILSILCRHLCRNVSSFASSHLVILQVSHP